MQETWIGKSTDYLIGKGIVLRIGAPYDCVRRGNRQSLHHRVGELYPTKPRPPTLTSIISTTSKMAFAVSRAAPVLKSSTFKGTQVEKTAKVATARPAKCVPTGASPELNAGHCSTQDSTIALSHDNVYATPALSFAATPRNMKPEILCIRSLYEGRMSTWTRDQVGPHTPFHVRGSSAATASTQYQISS